MNTKNQGFSIIEMLVAIGIFAILATAVVPSIVQTFTISRLGDNETDATLWTQEGIEATRSIRNLSWANLTDGNHGLSSGSGTWTFSGTNNSKGIYTRAITVSDVFVDPSGNPQTSGCANQQDGNLKRVVSTTSWNSSPTRANIVSLETYFTNWRKSAFGNWSIPLLDTSFDLSGNQDVSKTYVQGNYLYIVRNSSSPNFLVYNISGATPISTGNLTLTGNPTNIYVSGRYAYVSNSSDTNELQIIDVCTPSTPTLTGSFNASGNADGLGVWVSGNYAYLVRANSPDNEFIIVNVATPSAPILAGFLDLGEAGNEVVTLGNFAYVASSDNTQELKVINISNPSSPSLAGSLNLSGNNDAQSIAGFGSTIVIGRIGGEMDTIDVSTPSAPTLLGTYSAGNNINDISLGNGNLYVFLGTSNNTAEFQVINISNLASPTLLGSYNYAADINGVSSSSFNDRVYVGSSTNAQELGVFKPS